MVSFARYWGQSQSCSARRSSEGGPYETSTPRFEHHRPELGKATHPDFRYQPLSAPEEIGDAGRVRWVSGTPGKPPEYAGTDFLVARDGKIAAVYMFFDKL